MPRTGDPVDRIGAAIRRFQAGEEPDGAFREIYEAFFQPLLRFFARKGCSPDDCLDLTQETFFGIYKGLEGYEHRDRFPAWLFQVAKTVWLKRLRAAATVKRSAEEVSRDAMKNPEPTLATAGRQLDGVLTGERRRALQAAVAELPEQMRHCLTLRIYQQLSYREIALVNKISIETVKAHLFRARKKLKEQLADLDLGEEL